MKAQREWLIGLLLNGLTWIGAAGIAWKLLEPGGWLFRVLDLIARDQPQSYYYLVIGALVFLAAKVWLDRIDPYAFRHLLTALCAFAGTFFILSLLLPL